MSSSDAVRDRELHRYYEPWLEAFHDRFVSNERATRADGHVPQSGKDRALTAFAQLGALRLDMKRSIVSLIDSENSYILAEATRSLSLMDDAWHKEGDELWLGNSVLPRGQGVSQDALKPPMYTARGPGTEEFSAPALVVTDFEIGKYSDREYAASGGIHFYAGVPLVTKLGRAIGVYSVTHDEKRDGLTTEQLRVMIDMSTIVMNHLETIRNDRARARGERLINGIGSFLGGKEIEDEAPVPNLVSSSRKTDPQEHFLDPTGGMPAYPRDKFVTFKGMTIMDMNTNARAHYANEDSKALLRSDQNPSSDPMQTATPLSPGPGPESTLAASQDRPGVVAPADFRGIPRPGSNTRSQYLALFDRASRILRKSIAADGVAFIDASAANMSRGTSQRENTKSTGPPPSGVSESNWSRTYTSDMSKALGLGHDSDHGEESFSSDNKPGDKSDGGSSKKPHFHCEVISTALRDQYNCPALQISESRLRRLIRRYPSGKVFTLDLQGHIVTSDESSESAPASDVSIETQELKGASPKATAKPRNGLHTTLPDARNIVFLPLWDFAKERWNSAIVAWTSDPAKLLNIQDDLPYLTAFGNSVMNEMARLSLSVSDTAKATFLANISHELRSPLHGILGSIEFLHDSPLDDFQSNMVISVETCGKTLLDTVNHVLDFAKLSNLSKAKPQQGIARATTSDSSLTSQFDLAIVVEEAVEAVYAGQVFRQANAETLEGKGPSMTSSRKAMIKREDTKSRIAKGQREFQQEVGLTVAIDDGIDWQVSSQPGAVRRIIMNLLGNSLKYTERGSIHIALEVDHSRDDDEDDHVHSIITVIDTGKGMSDDFVKNHAFLAFSQEDSLTAGTGLGLSIIRSIIDGLGGKIHLKSEKGLGTEVKVWLSFPRPRKDLSRQEPGESSILHQMQARTQGMKLCMLWPDIFKLDPAKREPALREMPSLGDVISKVASDWLHVEVFSASSMDGQKADFFLYAEPPPIEYLLHQHGEHAKVGEVPIILLCQNAFQASSLRANGLHTLVELGRIIEIIAAPVGPQKLAKAFHRCMQRCKKLEQDEERNSSEHVTLATREKDAIADSAPGMKPKCPRASASLETVPARPADGKRATRPRHNSLSNHDQYDEDKQNNRYSTKPQQEQDPEDDRYARRPPLAALQRCGSVNSFIPRVLVVDDNSINLQLLETMMRKSKHPFESATNGLKAVEAYKKSHADNVRFKYILMDISMPIMDGVEATKEIRKWEKEQGIEPIVEIFALTGMGNESNAKIEAKETGFDRFLNKPVKFKELSALLT